MDRRYSIRLTDQGFLVSCAELGIETSGTTIQGAIAELKQAMAAHEALPRRQRKGRDRAPTT